jgi:acetoacetate decarboxylase
LRKLQRLLKILPDVDGKPKIVQLAGLHLTEITVKGPWSGPARLHRVPHVNAPVAGLQVRRIEGGRHFIADLTLPSGHVLVDYMKS